MSKRTIVVGLVASLSAPYSLAGDMTERFTSAQMQFEAGLRGSEKDNEQAAEKFRLLTEAQPENPLYLVYYGSTFAVKARDALLPWNKIKLGDTGLDLIDKALRLLRPEHDKVLVRGAPLSVETRLVAISTFLQVPDGVFHRFDRGRVLLEQTMKSDLFLSSPPPLQARFHFQAALAARQAGKVDAEVAHLTQTARLDANGPDATATADRLKELRR